MRYLQHFKIRILILTLLSTIASQAYAENKVVSSGNKDPRKQSISFEDELVEGSTQKPELFYLFQKKNFNYKRLIKLRENFIPEARRTTEDLQRGRGSN